MKKNILFIAVLFGVFAGMVTSCDDALETGSDRQIFNPSLSEKTDSMFYTLGILKGVQDAIDQYVLFNEMRGDLTVPNAVNATVDLKNLSKFSSEPTRYDSAYVYYRIINNCNYYIAHRDTALRTGSIAVAMPEYAQAHAIRAWAYLQLVKTYQKVPFYTEPILTISQAERIGNGTYLDIYQIRDELVADLEKFKNVGVPNYGEITVGTTNLGSTKRVQSALTMFPVALVLGDWYLETNEYEKAAKAYFSYLKDQKVAMPSYFVSWSAVLSSLPNSNAIPNDFQAYSTGTNWGSIFTMNPALHGDIITYVPLSVNKLRGSITDLPRLFGYNFYITPSNSVDSLNPIRTFEESVYLETRAIDPSTSYLNLCNNQTYYYYPHGEEIRGVSQTQVFGDLRRYVTLSDQVTQDRDPYYVMTKYSGANVPIYRASKVYLRMAEALNRAGYPDAAFAILKCGLNPAIGDIDSLKDETRDYLTNTIPFLATENRSIFTGNYGIHTRASGITRGDKTPYQLDTIVKAKLLELETLYPAYVVQTGTLADTINAVEDLICDEYALELAFEGNRFGDLCRIARHKNAPDIFGNYLYGTNFGGIWLKEKLAFKNPLKDLSREENWFIPLRRE